MLPPFAPWVRPRRLTPDRGAKAYYLNGAPQASRPRRRRAPRRPPASATFIARRSAAPRRRAERGEEAVAERSHRPDRRPAARTQAVLPVPSGDPVQHVRAAGDDRD